MEVDLIKEEEAQEFIGKYDMNAEATDFYRLLGGRMTFNKLEYKCYASYWINNITIDIQGRSNMYYSYYNNGIGLIGEGLFGVRNMGIRPIIRLSQEDVNEIFKNCNEILKRDEIKYSDNVKIKLGEFPQTKEYFEKQKKIERGAKETGNHYTCNMGDDSSIFPEYEIEGERYIKITPNVTHGEYTVYHESEDTRDGIPTWIKVEPIVWNVLKKDNQYILLSEKVLTTRQMLNERYEYRLSDIKELTIYKYLNDIFLKEIFANGIKSKEDKEDILEIDTSNSEENNANLSSQEMIKAALESGIPLFIHGKEIDGKSDIITLYDEDAETICLRNINKESLNGICKFDDQIGEMREIKPAWLKKLEVECEINPERIHIICFDEIDQASEDIKDDIINITEKNKVNGRWELPVNSRIVISGENEINDSLTKQFNSCINVNIDSTTVDLIDWIGNSEKPAIKNKDLEARPIHPFIQKYISNKKEKKMQIGLKKWIMASKLMYATNNPRTLGPVLGKEITKEFTEFYNKQEKEELEK